MVTVNIVTPLPINGKLVTSQSVLKVREGAGEKKKRKGKESTERPWIQHLALSGKA